MPTILFDQVGLPSGTIDRSRTDIITGAVLTITAASVVGTAVFGILDAPAGSTATLSGSGLTRTITPDIPGAWRMRVIDDDDDSEVIHTFTVRSYLRKLPAPASNETANAAANDVENDAADILASESNEGGSFKGWHDKVTEVYDAVDTPLQYPVLKVAHGFDAGDALYWDGTNYLKADASDGAKLGTMLVAVDVDADNFIVCRGGLMRWVAHGKTLGDYYFVSPTTPGAITATEPSAPDFSNPLLQAIDADTVLVWPWRPNEPGEAVAVTELLDCIPNFVQPTNHTSNQTNLTDTELEGILMEIPNDVEFNRLTLHVGTSWNAGGTGVCRICIYQSDDGTMKTSLAKVFDETIAGGDPVAGDPYDLAVGGGGTVTLKRGRYFLCVGLDDTAGGTLNPYLLCFTGGSFDGLNTDLISGGVPTSFEDLGAGTAASPPATINPTTLTGAAGRDNLMVHRFRKV
jgi:hypothetical protein